MWAIYLSRVIYSQTFIFLACAVMYFLLKMPLDKIVVAFVLMQVFSVFGAWQASRLKRRLGGMK